MTGIRPQYETLWYNFLETNLSETMDTGQDQDEDNPSSPMTMKVQR